MKLNCNIKIVVTEIMIVYFYDLVFLLYINLLQTTLMYLKFVYNGTLFGPE